MTTATLTEAEVKAAEQAANALTLNEKFREMETALRSEIFERGSEIHTGILALLAKKHHFQLGLPGTAKSLLVVRLVARIGGLTEDEFFHWLLTRYTNDSELYGPPRLSGLRNDIFHRNTERKLPRALIVFLDEVFKGNSSILNANLTAMNERKFFNHMDDPHIPLITMFAASNELPQGEELDALWDRFHFRHEVHQITETTNYVRMLKGGRLNPAPDPIITIEELATAQAAVRNVRIPDDVYEAFVKLRQEMKNEGLEATERRWVECLDIVRAEAFYNEHATADISDMYPLMHVLWNQPTDQLKIKKLVLDLANPIDRAAGEILDRVIGLEQEFKDALADTDNHKAVAKLVIDIHAKLKKAKKSLDRLEQDALDSERTSLVLPQLRNKIIDVAKTLIHNGLKMSGETSLTSLIAAEKNNKQQP